jgi:hypothetical protein
MKPLGQDSLFAMACGANAALTSIASAKQVARYAFQLRMVVPPAFVESSAPIVIR